MRRSNLKPKLLPDPQRQLKEAYREAKRREKALGVKRRSSTGAIGQYYQGEWIPSKWELECRKALHWMEKAGKIKDLRKEVVTFEIFNKFGQSRKIQIEIDLCFYHFGLKKHCRWDPKPPKVVHTRHGRRYPQKIHAGWFERFELLQFCEPDYDYRILEKGRIYTDIDF